MSRVSKILKPLLVFLWISGFYIFPVKSSSKLRRAVKIILNLIFVSLNIVSLAFLTLMNISSLSVKINQGESFLARLYSTTYTLSVLFLAVALPFTSSKHLRRLVSNYDRFPEDETLSHKQFRFMQVLLASGCVFAFLASVGVPVTIGAIGCVTCSVDDFHTTSEGFLTLATVLVRLAAFYSLLSIFASSLEFYALYLLLHFRANKFVKDVSSYDPIVLESSPDLLEKLRLRHESLCRLISVTSDVVGHFIAVVYAGGIPCFLFVIHGFVYRSLAWEEFVHMVAFFVELTITLCLVSVGGTLLNIKVGLFGLAFSGF